MPISPIITFKAGQCEVDTSSKPFKVKPQPEPGYIYLYSDDDLVHFCWRKRSDPLDHADNLDLTMVPTDGSFVPYEYKTTPQPTSKTDGRIFTLRFSSSSQRYLFWLQSKPQSRNGDPSYFSPRDRKIGDIVHLLLQGEDVDVSDELASVRNTDDRPEDDDDDDETMEDVEGHRDQHKHRGSGSGGAGPDATGGDIREEGEGSREGGADGARAVSSSAPDAAAAVRNFLDSLRDQSGLSGGQRQQNADKSYPYLNHLLPTSMTVPMIDAAPAELADSLINFLPPAVIVLATSAPGGIDGNAEPSAAAVEAAKASLTLDDKRSLLKKVLRSPQFNQALGTLTMALRDGGLPSIAEALGVKVPNGGYIPGGGVPLGGGHAVEAFVEGVKKTAQEEKK
ncbi:proteasome complex subunit Rpn13 ubiquitin receptor-domain-containing protein [Dactylonectria macrodidyma]|uniref:Proteasome complex subunit Rpn13 ubiquitin receptor-domain-containing protein n=1 Tax=Dactylonectria macrodidyma TaxID=307937 RepID=A0A9P9FR73_9HYPO|nr:proteasome complex subunit Rpn13 ubiquitin receptor-domain-containing protein [Dactylonectria macrodidyma]